MWDPQTYLTYADERTRPARDLLAAVDVARPAAGGRPRLRHRHLDPAAGRPLARARTCWAPTPRPR